jgi:drug/metabolite transporter (DMT)-like permease
LQDRDALSADRSAPASGEDAGPDPVIGAGLALLGIFLMGIGGARDAHYVFNVGVVIAVVGAIVFVLFVALSALKQRRALTESEAPPR